MKKLLTTIAVIGAITTGASAEINFQKTYEVPGMKADEIRTAFGSLTMNQADSKMDQLGKALRLITLDVSVLKSKKDTPYPVKCVWMATNQFYDGDVILQARDGRYRVTISNLRDADTGNDFVKAPASLQSKCKEQMSQWADDKFQQVKKLAF
jgi:hypothetical protein